MKMNMKRFTALSLIAVLSASALCACSSANTSSTDSETTSAAEETTAIEETTEEETTVAETASQTESTTSYEVTKTTYPVDESCALYNFTVKIDGVEYSIPGDVSVFEANGYALAGEDEELQSYGYTIMSEGLEKEGATEINAEFWNPSDTAKKLSQCQVGYIAIYLYDDPDVVLPGDFKFDKTVTVDDIISQYGQPTTYKDSQTFYTLTYQLENYRKVEFTINKSGSASSNLLTIENYV